MQDAVPASRHAVIDRGRRVLVATLLVLAALAWAATIALAGSPAAMSVMPGAGRSCRCGCGAARSRSCPASRTPRRCPGPSRTPAATACREPGGAGGGPDTRGNLPGWLGQVRRTRAWRRKRSSTSFWRGGSAPSRPARGARLELYPADSVPAVAIGRAAAGHDLAPHGILSGGVLRHYGAARCFSLRRQTWWLR
jgi:hypothetical protein